MKIVKKQKLSPEQKQNIKILWDYYPLEMLNIFEIQNNIRGKELSEGDIQNKIKNIINSIRINIHREIFINVFSLS